MTPEEALLPVRAEPETDAERALVATALVVYREQRQQYDVDPATAWKRVTDLCDDSLVTPVSYAEQYDTDQGGSQ